jgi:hypothetical protein
MKLAEARVEAEGHYQSVSIAPGSVLNRHEALPQNMNRFVNSLCSKIASQGAGPYEARRGARRSRGPLYAVHPSCHASRRVLIQSAAKGLRPRSLQSARPVWPGCLS